MECAYYFDFYRLRQSEDRAVFITGNVFAIMQRTIPPTLSTSEFDSHAF
jgi:hypothetical protein